MIHNNKRLLNCESLYLTYLDEKSISKNKEDLNNNLRIKAIY